MTISVFGVTSPSCYASFHSSWHALVEGLQVFRGDASPNPFNHFFDALSWRWSFPRKCVLHLTPAVLDWVEVGAVAWPIREKRDASVGVPFPRRFGRMGGRPVLHEEWVTMRMTGDKSRDVCLRENLLVLCLINGAVDEDDWAFALVTDGSKNHHLQRVLDRLHHTVWAESFTHPTPHKPPPSILHVLEPWLIWEDDALPHGNGPVDVHPCKGKTLCAHPGALERNLSRLSRWKLPLPKAATNCPLWSFDSAFLLPLLPQVWVWCKSIVKRKFFQYIVLGFVWRSWTSSSGFASNIPSFFISSDKTIDSPSIEVLWERDFLQILALK